jgi:hypothetical protein
MDFLGLTPAEADDLYLLAAIYVIAVGFLLWAYVLAGQVWVERHSVHYKTETGMARVSGFWGEWVLFTACACVVVVALLFTSVDFSEMMARNWGNVGIGFVAVFLIYLVYAWSVVRAARNAGALPEYRHRLRNAYVSYAVYSVLFFAFGALVVVLLGFEFFEDKVAFDHEMRGVFAALDQAKAYSATGQLDASLAFIEDANGRMAIATNQLQDQLNPTFLFAACVFLLNILIAATPIKNAFMSGAKAITQVTTAIAIGGIIVMGMLVYFGSYAVMIDTALLRIDEIRPNPAAGAWEAMQRYNQIVVDLSAKKNLLGFAGAMGGEGSGIAAFAGGIQFTVDRVSGGAQKAAHA